ncbi:MAG: hypothetical protein PHN89_05635 [Candidatus Pacebacteria bacterium]|nr:hypothetical protein [Candidatus Paceibacterota bacterium]
MGDIPKDTTPVETPQEEKPAEYSYEDVHKETPKDIAENKEIPEGKNAVEKKAEEIKPEEKKPEEKPEEVLDTGKLAKEVATEVAKEIKPAEPTPPEKTEEEVYQEWAKTFEEEHGRIPTWTEAMKYLKEESTKEVLKTLEERETKKREDEEKVKTEQEENDKVLIKNFNETIDGDLEDLYANGKLTPIKDEKNKADQGVIERKALFQTMLDVNAKRAEEGKKPIYSVKEIYYEHYKKPTSQPAGADAPVSLGKGVSPQPEGDEKELDYVKDVQKSTWGAMRNLLKPKSQG